MACKTIQKFCTNLKINISTNTKPTKMNFTIMDFPRSALSNNIVTGQACTDSKGGKQRKVILFLKGKAGYLYF